jgi:hypothetical protein
VIVGTQSNANVLVVGRHFLFPIPLPRARSLQFAAT